MPIIYDKNIVYAVLCTVHCSLYYTMNSVWPKSCICHYCHSCDGGGVVVVLFFCVFVVVVLVLVVVVAIVVVVVVVVVVGVA